MSNSQLNKSKSGIKNGTEVTMKLSTNVVYNSNYENNYMHKFLTNTQVLRLREAFSNSSWVNIKLSKTKSHKIGQSGGFSGRHLGPLLKTGLSLTGNVLKSISVPQD